MTVSELSEHLADDPGILGSLARWLACLAGAALALGMFFGGYRLFIWLGWL